MNMDLGRERLRKADIYCTKRNMAWRHASITVKNTVMFQYVPFLKQ